MSTALSRTMLLWCPDWPLVAAAAEHALAAELPLALTERGLVFACSAAARADGVRRGMRLREAQSRSTALVALPYDPILDARAFEPVILALEEITPGVQVIRPGMCAIRARGPRRYYGGELPAARAVLDRLVELGVSGARIGIADGAFAAELAAKVGGGEPVAIVPEDGSPAFLAPLPVGVLETEGPADAGFVTLLRRLGVRTLGGLAALSESDVESRFGPTGARSHRAASGRDTSAVVPRTAPAHLERSVSFEPPLDRIDQVTFAVRVAAEEFVAGLTAALLVCTGIRVEVTDENGRVSARSWLHPRWFAPADVVDRVRWQLQGSGAIDAGLGAPISRVNVVPEAVDEIGHHEQGLWGSAPDERIHHGLSRVQSMLGHDAVVTAVLGGGRELRERQHLVPWGDRAPAEAARRTLPWPGALPPPLPGTVFDDLIPVQLRGPDGEAVAVDERGGMSSEPTGFAADAHAALSRIQGWAGPWPVDERWWDPEHARHYDRFQVIDADGTAWLLVAEGSGWFAEARYD
ncbi:DNA polymerase Y family protein [Microbacteriaceae bacterium VKM Ac-2855]|nr:DNA polymerase Y family protein [Microbacteriaceae bacterium VKM Ac-2855]